MDVVDGSAGPASRWTSLFFALLRSSAWTLSGLLLVFATACCWGRYDACTVVTLFPTWCWAAVGLFIAWLAFSRRRWRPSAVLAAAWLAFVVTFADSPASLVRVCLPEPERGEVRVVSVNCASSATAARDVRQFDPDIVLLQESPWAEALAALASELFGSSANLVRGPDASILARGRVTPVAVPPEFYANFVHARVELDGRTINVISLRLYPCPIRLDLWSPTCWRYYESNRATRRRQLARIADYVKTLPADEPLILGGDFNCPPRDAVLSLLKPRLTDAFPVAGRGWGATIIEVCGWPLIRIDQIWTSSQLHATNVFAHRADSSDHHLVVADFALDDPQNRWITTTPLANAGGWHENSALNDSASPKHRLSDIPHRAPGFRLTMLALASQPISRFLVVFWATLPLCALAAEARIDQPNQYPSPTVKQPAADEKFDDDYPWWENTLTGDWRGWRTELAERGVVFDIRYVSVMMQNTHGGFDTGFVGGGPLGITTTIDTEELCGHEGGTLFLDWEFYNWYNGRYPPTNSFDPSGSFVGVNTNFIESDVAELNQLAQLFYEQSWLDDGAVLAFGKMDANVRFASVQAAGAFQNSIAMYTSTLNRFIPTYPNEATALVAQIGDANSLVGKFGWFDGTSAAYNPVTGVSGPDTGPRGPSTFFNNDGNWWLVAEVDAAWHVDSLLPGSLGVGAWLQTGRVATLGTDTDGVSDIPGWYLQWQQMLWTPSVDLADDGGGVTYFGQFGWSDPNKNPVHWSLMTGLSATGVFANRPADAVGLMFAHSHFTSDPGVYESTQRNGLPGPTGGSETSLESFYIWQWQSWSYLQPGAMWIVSPGGGDPAPLNDALLAYLLVGVAF